MDPECGVVGGCDLPLADVNLIAGVGGEETSFVDCNTLDFDGLCPGRCGIRIASGNCQIISIGGVAYGPILFLERRAAGCLGTQRLMQKGRAMSSGPAFFAGSGEKEESGFRNRSCKGRRL